MPRTGHFAFPLASTIVLFVLGIVGGPQVANAAPAPSPSMTSVPSPPNGGEDRSAFPGDWSQLFPTVLATFLGAGLALWTAVRIEQTNERRAQERETSATRARQREALDAIHRELEWNEREAGEISAELTTHLRTERALLVDTWAATGSDAMRTGTALSGTLSETYALLRRCNRLLDQYAAEVGRGGAGTRMARTTTLPRLQTLMAEAAETVQGTRQQLQAELASA